MNRFLACRAGTGALICKPLKEPRNRFPACLAGTTTLFVVPARQATLAGEIDSSELIPWLLKSLKIRPQDPICRNGPPGHIG
jgi:hypothetical protein